MVENLVLGRIRMGILVVHDADHLDGSQDIFVVAFLNLPVDQSGSIKEQPVPLVGS